MASVQNSYVYTVTALHPADTTSPLKIEKFKALRLEALRLVLMSFVSNYAHEASFMNDEWMARLARLAHYILICEYHDRAENARSLPPLEDEWVGILTFFGPLSASQYDFLDREGLPPGNDEEETRWHLGGLYLQAEHRGRETAIVIHQAVLDFLRDFTDARLETIFDEDTGLERPKRARVGGVVPSQDSMLTQLYQNLGGHKIGWVKRKDAVKFTGNEELLMGGMSACEERVVVIPCDPE